MRKEICKGIELFRYEKCHDDLFEGCWPIENGVSINGYLVTGSEKKAMIDYVEHGASFDEDLAPMGLSLADIDYLVLNHLEPDHTGALSDLFARRPDITVYATRLAATMVSTLYGYTNVHVVANGEELSLGDKTLVFYSTPNIHWPETMMTFVKEDQVLFSCDAFGAFGAYKAFFDDELTEAEWALLRTETERYYANIVAPFSSFVLRGINALASVPVKTVCPSHGVVWRKDPGYVIAWYQKLATYLAGPQEKEVAILYSSMYGNTLQYVNDLIEDAKKNHVTIHLVRIPDENDSFALADVWRCHGIVVAAPTYERELFPSMAHTLDLLIRKGVKGRVSMYFGSSLWSGGAGAEYKKAAEAMAFDVVDIHEFRGRGTDADKEAIMNAFHQLCEKL